MSASVSVVIPAFNSGRTVEEAVASALDQSVPPLEVIVVDDGSSDDTAERVARFGPPVRYVQQANAGVSVARNHGVRLAAGEWVAFLDADDAWHPRKLERQLAATDGFGLIAAHTYAWPGAVPPVTAGPPRVEHIRPADLAVKNRLVTSTVLVRTDVLRATGEFDPALRGPEDYDLWLRVARHATLGRVPEPLAGYRVGTPGSLSKNAGRMETGMRAILGKLDAAGAFRGRPLLRRKAWAYHRYQWAYLHREAGRPATAARHAALSLAGYPLPFARDEVRYVLGRVRLLATCLTRRTP